MDRFKPHWRAKAKVKHWDTYYLGNWKHNKSHIISCLIFFYTIYHYAGGTWQVQGTIYLCHLASLFTPLIRACLCTQFCVGLNDYIFAAEYWLFVCVLKLYYTVFCSRCVRYDNIVWIMIWTRRELFCHIRSYRIYFELINCIAVRLLCLILNYPQ